MSRKQRKWTAPTDTGAYIAWNAMHQRCSPTSRDAPYYAQRGITVCPEWSSFDRFYADMGDRPPGTTLERQENSRGYSAVNCCWATRKQQVDNRRNTVVIEFKGEKRTMSEWAKHLGLPYYMLWNRIRKHKMPLERALVSNLLSKWS